MTIINKNLAIKAKQSPCKKEIEMAFAEYTQSISTMTKGVAEGKWHLLLMGEPGSGKTQTVVDTLNEHCRDKWVGIKGTSSAIGLYKFLYEHRAHKVIVIDDSDAIYSTPEAAEILKAAMDSKKTRMVSWQKQSTNLNSIGVPNSFVVKSHIILITNSNLEHDGGRLLKQQKLMKPVVDRVMKLKTGMPNRQWEIDYLKYVHREGKILCFTEKNIPLEAQNEIIDFVSQEGTHFNHISFRTLVKICDFYNNDKDNWKQLSLMTVA